MSLDPYAHGRLHALLVERRCKPFAWGTSDCASLAFDAVLATTGRDLFADLRESYSDARGAMQRLRELGGMRGLCRSRLGLRVDPADVIDGDVCQLQPAVCDGPSKAHGALGVAWAGSVVAQGPDGLVTVDRAHALRWWRAA